MTDGATRLRWEIERLREGRRRREGDASIGGVVSATAANAQRAHRRLGALIDVWESLVPAEIAAHTRLVGLRRGVAHVVVGSASVGYVLDRMLRGGLEQELRLEYRGTLVKVRITVGQRG